MTDADIELQHILIEAQSERWANIERFLFSYHCYRKNHVTKSDKPCWESARNELPRSLAVKSIKDGVIEPLIPEKDVVGLIKKAAKDDAITSTRIKSILTEFLHYVVLSRTEKRMLVNSPLANNMPREWYQNPQWSHARLEQIGVKIL